MPLCGVCVFVRLSRSWVASKQIKICSNFFHHRVAKPFQFFCTKRDAIFRRNPPPNGGVECGWGRQKAPFWTNIVAYTRRRRSVCDGLDVIRRKETEVNPPPYTTLLVITPFSAAVGHRRTEPGGYFCWKLTLTRSPDPIRPTRRGPGPNRLT